MKTKLTFLGMLLLAAIFSVNATVWTVSNNANSPGQFTDVQPAIDAASPGDTIYISGSPVTYGGGTLTKSLVLIGAGYHPDKQVNYNTSINTMNLVKSAIEDASGSTIIGISFTAQSSNLYMANNQATALQNIELSRCNIKLVSIGSNYYQGKMANILFNNCIISTIQVFASSVDCITSMILKNNFILAVDGFLANTGNLLFDHNILCGAGILSSKIKGAMFSNNIFFGFSPYVNDVRNCTFNNNISYGSGNNVFNLGGTNSGAGNFEDQNPQFVSVAATGFDFTYDYNLQAGSPGELAGSDGTDIGIYGGSYPFPVGGTSGSGFQTSQESTLPQVYEMNIQNGSIGLNGTIDVIVKARKQD